MRALVTGAARAVDPGPGEMVMRQAMAAACLVLAGCASGGAGAGSGTTTEARAPQEQTTTISGPTGSSDIRTTRSDPTATFQISAPPERVFSALSAVYETLGLKVNTLDTQARRIGVESARVRRQIGGERMSRYLECGDRLGGRVAETDDITLTLMTQVVPSTGGSTLRTLVDARARPVGVSGNAITCATTGDLEERIVELVRTIVAR